MLLLLLQVSRSMPDSSAQQLVNLNKLHLQWNKDEGDEGLVNTIRSSLGTRLTHNAAKQMLRGAESSCRREISSLCVCAHC